MAEGHDAPLVNRDDDELGRWGVARAIHRVIESAPANWSTRVGLYGKWGAGKTSVLNFLCQIESEKKSLVVRVSAWNAVAESGILELFYSELGSELKRKGVKLPKLMKLRGWISAIPGLSSVRGLSAVAVAALNISSPGAGELATSTGKVVASRIRFKKSDVDTLLDATKRAGFRRIVVFIDDLDRADPRLLPSTLLALRELLDWPGLAFVLAFDKEVVGSALGQYSSAFGASADRFLQKVIDVAFVLPEPTREQSQKLAMRAFASCASFLTSNTAVELARYAPTNPRVIKLAARSIGAMSEVSARHDDGEVDWFMLGLHVMIRAVSPRAADVLERELARGRSAEIPDLVLSAQTDEGYIEAVWSKVEAECCPDQGENDRAYIRRLAEKIIRSRRYAAAATVVYELRLVFEEPPFTLREYGLLVANSAVGDSAIIIAKGIEEGAARNGASTNEVADDLAKLAVLGYDLALVAASKSRTRDAYRACCDEASRRHAFLSALYDFGEQTEMGQAARKPTHCGSMWELFLRWLPFDANPEDIELRRIERKILIASFAQCSDPRRLYANLKPWFWDQARFTLPGVDVEQVERWRNEVIAVIVPSVVESVVREFLMPDGVSSLNDVDDAPLGAWMLTSPSSPMYVERRGVEALMSVLHRASSDPSEAGAGVLCQNAYTFLQWTFEEVRGGSWATTEQRAANASQHVDLIAAVWSAVVVAPYQFRMLSSIRRLRSAITGAGVPSEAVPEPEWLRC